MLYMLLELGFEIFVLKLLLFLFKLFGLLDGEIILVLLFVVETMLVIFEDL